MQISCSFWEGAPCTQWAGRQPISSLCSCCLLIWEANDDGRGCSSFEANDDSRRRRGGAVPSTSSPGCAALFHTNSFVGLIMIPDVAYNTHQGAINLNYQVCTCTCFNLSSCVSFVSPASYCHWASYIEIPDTCDTHQRGVEIQTRRLYSELAWVEPLYIYSTVAKSQ